MRFFKQHLKTRKTSNVTARGVPPTPYRSHAVLVWGGVYPLSGAKSGGGGGTPCPPPLWTDRNTENITFPSTDLTLNKRRKIHHKFIGLICHWK